MARGYALFRLPARPKRAPPFTRCELRDSESRSLSRFFAFRAPPFAFFFTLPP